VNDASPKITQREKSCRLVTLQAKNHGLWRNCGGNWIASKSAYGLDTGKSLAQHKET
jgi:hypothetical protein